MVNKRRLDLGTLSKAAKKGLDSAAGMVGEETDPKLIYFNKLGENHFKILAEHYGVGTIAEYIRDMEYAKSRGGKNG